MGHKDRLVAFHNRLDIHWTIPYILIHHHLLCKKVVVWCVYYECLIFKVSSVVTRKVKSVLYLYDKKQENTTYVINIKVWYILIYLTISISVKNEKYCSLPMKNKII